MARPYSQDLRDRVIDAVVQGGMSRRGAAARFGISELVAIKWVERFERTGLRTPGKMGGHKRLKLERHREFLEACHAEKPDVTLQALCDRLLGERQGRHFVDEPVPSPHRLDAQKKTLIACEQDRPDVKRHRIRWRKYQKLVDPSRLVFIDETWTKTNMTRLYGWAPRGRRLVDKVPHGHWKTSTFLAAIGSRRLVSSTARSTASASSPTSRSS